MLTVSINSTASQLTFSHPNLDNTYLYSLTLTREYGCNSTVLSVDVSDVTITNGSFLVDVEAFYGQNTTKTKIDDGVYKFTVGFDYPAGDDIGELNHITITYCFVVDYDLKCKILNDFNPLVLDKYRTMFFANDCDTCNCSHLCTIYNDLIQSNITYVTTCGSC